MSTRTPSTPAPEAPVQPSVERIQSFLFSTYSRVFTLNDVMNNRRRVFGELMNYVSPKTGTRVSDLLDSDQVGEVIDRIKASHLARVSGSVDCGF